MGVMTRGASSPSGISAHGMLAPSLEALWGRAVVSKGVLRWNDRLRAPPRGAIVRRRPQAGRRPARWDNRARAVLGHPRGHRPDPARRPSGDEPEAGRSAVGQARGAEP